MINTAAKHIRRAPYQALTAVLIMTTTFFVATLLTVLAYSTSTLLKHYETSPQVIAYLKSNATTLQITTLQRRLESDARVKKVSFVTREQAMEIYKQATAGNPLLSQYISPNVFPASLEFSIKNLNFAQGLIDEVTKDPAIDEVAFTASLGSSQNLPKVVERLTRISNYVRIGGAASLSFLLLSSLLVLLVIIGMRISSRRDEIEILQLIGATPGFIRGPFILEGIFYSTVGALVGWLFGFLGVLYASPALSSFFGDIPFLPTDILDLLTLLGIVLGGELLLAILLGATGSLVAIKRYLKI
ncbi:MAG: FtsX-like permease family protein [Candidatus Blackburnbacteria bacterium]|nr:FtsX-like permease family protein [Candidatus Blackburnbacteria bacterium]